MSAAFWLGGLIGTILFGAFIILAERLTHKLVNFLLYGNAERTYNL